MAPQTLEEKVRKQDRQLRRLRLRIALAQDGIRELLCVNETIGEVARSDLLDIYTHLSR